MTAKVAAKRRVDRKPVRLTVVRGGKSEGKQDTTLDVLYFTVLKNRGSYTLKVTPIVTPSRPLWKRLLRLS